MPHGKVPASIRQLLHHPARNCGSANLSDSRVRIQNRHSRARTSPVNSFVPCVLHAVYSDDWFAIDAIDAKNANESMMMFGIYNILLQTGSKRQKLLFFFRRNLKLIE